MDGSTQLSKEALPAVVPSGSPAITPVALRSHLIDVLLISASLGIITVSCSCVSLVLEVNALRINEAQSAAELKTGLFSRADAFLWKGDTFLTIASAKSKNLSAELTQVRVQVKRSSEDTQLSTSRATKSAAEVVARATTEW